ncbi:hypothetical protein CANARDRAFT_27765 [[Candida] arabinofermentans NRRL YB-2248]|uniref:tRNA pseudouridine synthase 1 n=1 Tax=[Candida] arabinofermentans NRRL YB-2248 TaxID=983967 RepID=A0A1E4T1Q6_9ASCO|nr:hypothetical protein CANARDRAFT_27765 [[Candida] arabinofermentans NRRL YB-2248]
MLQLTKRLLLKIPIIQKLMNQTIIEEQMRNGLKQENQILKKTHLQKSKDSWKGTRTRGRIVTENGQAVYGDEERRPKKKVACMIGYCGTGYHGMQLNPPARTIEGDLFDAFVKAGAISKNNSNDLKKSGFQRAARTDKGVHAAGNVVSLKMIIEDEDIVEKINSYLPDQIRLWGYERVNKSFDCRKMCGSRVYEYLMPTYSFLPPKPTSPLAKLIKEADTQFPGSTRSDPEGEVFWKELFEEYEKAGITLDIQEQIQQAISEDITMTVMLEEANKKMKKLSNEFRRKFRCSSEKLQLVRDALQIYVGSHNFHNFTNGKHFRDPSARRFMKSITVSEPIVVEGTEWVSIKIHGQSFMLHQIRKMIGMATLVVRTGCPLDRIKEAFGADKVNIPKAPSLGLLLEQTVYDAYNEKLKDFGYNPLNFDKFEKEMNEFKMKHIYDKIYDEEVKENVFYGFFGFIDGFNGSDEVSGTPIFSFLTAKGIEKTGGDKTSATVNSTETSVAENKTIE